MLEPRKYSPHNSPLIELNHVAMLLVNLVSSNPGCDTHLTSVGVCPQS